MAATCRFDDEDTVRRLSAGCPLRSMPPARDESSCARCPGNAGWPGESTIGCRVVVPGPVWKHATSELMEKAPELFDAVHALRRGSVGADQIKAASVVVERWAALTDLSPAGQEAAAAGRAFLRAATATRLGVRLWE